MTMTKKQLKAIRRHKNIRRKRNIRTNNLRANPIIHALGKSHTYMLYEI